MAILRSTEDVDAPCIDWPLTTPSLATVLASIDDHVACYDRQWRYTFVNDKAAEVLGKSKEDLLGHSIWDLFPDAIGNQYFRELHDAVADGRVRRFEHYYPPFDRWFENHVYPHAEGVTVLALDITERKRLEESHREHEALLHTVGDNLPGAIYQVSATRDGQRKFQYISAGIESLLGLKPADVMANSMRLYSLIVPEDIPRVLAEEERAYRTLQPFDCEFRQRTVSGEVRWMHCRSAPRCSRDGVVVWDGVVLDVTDRKRAEQALERYRLLAQRTDDIVLFMRTSDGSIVEANAAALEAYGYTYEELMNCKIAELRDPTTMPLLAEQMRQADQFGITFETVHRRKDGSTFPVEVSSRGTDMDGQRVLLSIIRDITARRQATRAIEFLSEASKVLASSLDYQTTLAAVARLSVPELADWCAIDVLESDGSLNRVAVAHVNAEKMPLAHEIHRLTQSNPQTNRPLEIIRTGESELVSEFDADLLEQSIRDPQLLDLLKQIGARSYIGVPLKLRDRTLGVMTFVSAESGRRFGAADLALAQDLAHRAAMAIENSRLYAEVSEASRRKDEFLATLAHELRNPLAPIRNASELFGLLGPLPSEMQQASEIVDRQLDQLTRLVDDLFDVSRITRGKLELRCERILLSELIERAVEMSRPLIDASRHEVAISLSPEPLVLDADPARITQVVANLLNNSAKYMEPGGRISLSTRRAGAEAVIAVSDTGIGIPAEMLSRIFEPFMQADTSVERRQGGLGIGLTLAQRLVQLHGGTIQGFSTGRNCGSTFEVRLPLAASVREVDSHHPKQVSPGVRPQRILVVDDNRDSADTLRILLRKLGHEVQTAYDGLEALQVAVEFQPRFLLLDLGMPGMSGFDVARELRKRPDFEQATFVALTGWGQENDRRRTLEAGFDYHLVKPVELRAIQELLAKTGR
jgi:PAS domain S-box-containing protein